MPGFQFIECEQAKTLLSTDAVLFDIRDQNSFQTAHAKEAIHLHNDNLATLLSAIDKNRHVLIICYHGNSSQGAAQYIFEQGFSNVYSVNGGFEVWRNLFPADLNIG